MKNRKRLAVLMADVSNISYQHMLLDGILSQAYALNYDVVIFTPFLCYESQSAYQRGESQIFSLVNYDMFDAVLYASCSFYNDVVRGYVEQGLTERCHCPIIALESDDVRYHCIQVDDRAAFAQVVSHLIEAHSIKDILCLTGFEGNYQAEERAAGYRDAMEVHGLTVSKEHVIYGDFWKFRAESLAHEFLEKKRPLPEAVVCCCDTVAITLINCLVEGGIRVPEDVIVASYDAGTAAAENVPSVTTYMRPLADIGMRGVLKAHELLTGEVCQPVYKDHGRLVPAESCGCGEDFHQKFKARQREIKNVEESRKLFEDTPMAERLNSMTNLNGVLTQIINHFYLINGLNDYYFCMCEGWDDLEKNTDDESVYNQYTDTMHLRITNTDGIGMIVDEKFPKSELLPILHVDRDEPRAYYVTPLHFNTRCFGYAAMGFGSKIMAFDALYHSWNRNLNNALEFIRIRNNFNSMNQRLFMNSIRDTLTGIYNRQGFNHFSEELFRKAQYSPDKKLLVLAADLDQLKMINDTYGHIEGDNAISVVANALNTCFEYGEICCRTGGDEFLVIGCAEYTEELVAQYIRYIQRFFERYNSSSGRTYEIGASLGYVCETVQPGRDLKSYIDEADARMYANKVERKKLRQ